MLRNNIILALRNLYKRKLYSSINILGLTVGMTCFILLSMYVFDELTFDRFHHNADNIYRLVEQKNDEDDGRQIAAVSYRLSEDLETEFPEVRDASQMMHMGRAVIRNEENNREYYCGMVFGDQSLLQIFDFELFLGDDGTCLSAPNTVILSVEYADKLFPNQDPIGKQVVTDRDIDFSVSGVFDKIPNNSHLQFDAIFSMPTIQNLSFYERIQTDWSSNVWITYLHLEDDALPQQTALKINELAAEHSELAFTSNFFLQPLRNIHFHSGNIEGAFNYQPGNLSYVYVFSFIALFILMLACINYINLSTASSENYGKETGVRKVLGADGKSIFRRYLIESSITTLISLTVAISLVRFLLPSFNSFTGKELSLFAGTQTIFILLGLTALVIALSGSYPSLYLSRFKPVDVLKSSFVNMAGGHINFRRGLVIFQFIISTVMIMATITAYKQMNFISKKNLGFSQENMLVVDINSGRVRQGFQVIKDGYAGLPEVKEVSVSTRVPGEWKVIPQVKTRLPGQLDQNGDVSYFLGVDEDFLSTFDIDLVNGQSFDGNRISDSTSVLVNESAAQLFGLENASGQQIDVESRIWDGNEVVFDDPLTFNVIGIVNDFHFQSLHEPIRPLILMYRNTPIHSIDYFTVKYTPENTEKTIASLTNILQAVDPAHIFEYHFLDEQLASFYETDRRRSQIFSIAALLAIFISCLGMLGLASYTIAKRTKEIGIRKVLGASIPDIVTLFTREFSGLVIIGSILAIPISFFVMKRWLEGFSYHIPLSWWIFMGGVVIAVFISIVTISLQCIRAASSNPIESLKYE